VVGVKAQDGVKVRQRAADFWQRPSRQPDILLSVTSAGLAWIEAAGFRALPPVEGPVSMIATYELDRKAELHALMLENPDHAAEVGFRVLGRFVRTIIELRHGGPWHIQAERIGELNRHVQGPVVIVARRDSPVSS
jgi:hypothetical protein